MSAAKIWAWSHGDGDDFRGNHWASEDHREEGSTTYIRADIAERMAEALRDAQTVIGALTVHNVPRERAYARIVRSLEAYDATKA